MSVHSAGKCAWHGIGIHKARVNVHKLWVIAQGVGGLCVAWVSVHSMCEYGGVHAPHGENTLHG